MTGIRSEKIDFDKELCNGAKERKRLRHHQGLKTRRTARPQMPRDLSRNGRPCGHRRLLVVRGLNESRA